MKFSGGMIGILCSLLLLSACVTPRPISEVTPASTSTHAPFQSATHTQTPAPSITLMPSATRTPLPSPTLTMTLTPTLTPTHTPQPTPTWSPHPAGDIVAPILLYHHVADGFPNNRYYVDLKTFRLHLETLKQLGYTGITISTLADVIVNGGALPPRPVAITFDDGDEDVYQNAFPIMKELGFVATFYIVVGAVDTYHIVTTDQLKEMIDAGWEIGSHSMTHPDFRNPPNGLRWEGYTSRIELEKKIGVPVKSFAYPFGIFDSFVAKKIKAYGYTSAVGLGNSYKHGMFDLYYLVREEVQSHYDLTAFGKLLPWTDVPTALFP